MTTSGLNVDLVDSIAFFRKCLLQVILLLAFPYFVFCTQLDQRNENLNVMIDQYCMDCHDDTAKGGLDLDLLSRDLSKKETLAKWINIYDMVESGEMPPKKKDQPPKSLKMTFLKELGRHLSHAHSAQKQTVLRRLNRYEYENTMNDLFGTQLKLSEAFPEDGRSHEFDNVGASLAISMTQMKRYLESAGIVIEEAIETWPEPKAPITTTYRYSDHERLKKFHGNQWLKTKDGDTVFFRRLSYPSGLLQNARIKENGFYKIRVKAYVYQGDRPITMSIEGATYERGKTPLIYGFREVRPGFNHEKPQEIEMEVFMEKNYMLKFEPWGIYDKKNLIKANGVENYTGEGLAIVSVELEGPIRKNFPSQGHQLMFSGVTRNEIQPKNPNDKKRKYYRPKFKVESDDFDLAAKTALLQIAEQAFRRPLQQSDIQPYFELYKADRGQGLDYENSMKTAVKGIFCSPDFLYFQENKGNLNDFALATRLSYALTRTLPDEILLKAAEEKQLSKKSGLKQHAERLMQSKHFDRFIKDFSNAWLGLRDINFTSPDKTLFPEFDPYLQESMLIETRAYLKEMIKSNLGAEAIVRSNFAMLNERLAKHYGLPKVDGAVVKKVKLDQDSVRGGLITNGSILKVSANGTNTSPIVRGIWLLERILGVVPRPPPPGIPGVEPDIRGATTLREMLDQHRNQESCKSCHQVIDPPGFAFESFNPVGGWRDHFRSLKKGEKVNLYAQGKKVRYKKGLPVDSASELPTGEKFKGFMDYRDHLANQPERLAKNFLKKFLTFSTGRDMGFSDRKEIASITKSCAPHYGIKDLMLKALDSQIFRNK